MQHTVSVHFLRLLTDYLVMQAVSVPEFLSRAGFDQHLLEDSNNRVPFDEFSRLCQRAKRQLDEPFLGLKLAKNAKPSHLGSFGFALMACPTGLEMMNQTTRYTSLAIDAAHTVFEKHGDEYVRYRRSNLPDHRPLGQLQDELSNGIWVTLGRWLWNRNDLKLNWVSFTYEEPTDVSEYEDFFRCPIRFSTKETAIAYFAGGVLQPAPQADNQMLSIMNTYCNRLLKELSFSHEPVWMSLSREAVLMSLKKGMPHIRSVAEQANLSEKEFQHLLSEHGYSFRSFVDDLRHGLAASYMNDARLSLAEISYQLGFSEQSAFQRAFKRWTGVTPGKYRELV